MYAIKEGAKNINNEKVKVFARDVNHAGAELVVRAGSTGFRGRVPREKSARTYFALGLIRGDLKFDPVYDDETGELIGLEVAALGDGGLMALIDSLAFALQALTDA